MAKLRKLSFEDILNFETVKTAVPRTYELVPEASRLKFWDDRKAAAVVSADG